MSFGSKRFYPYTDDDGVVHGIQPDESNVEMVNAGADALNVPSGLHRLPPDIKARFVRLETATGTVKRVPILTREIYDAITIGQAFAAPSVGEEEPAQTSYVVVQKVPERLVNPVIPLDTGKIDGDQP